MPRTATRKINLANVFQTVTQVLSQNQTSLNQADEVNHDHGDNMVQTFEVIAQAMKERKNATPAEQLEYAAQLLRQQTNSGSSQIYASGLQNAAAQFQNRPVNQGNAMELIQTLMGMGGQAGGASASSGAQTGDMLGSLLGGLMGGGAPAQQQPAASSGSAGLDLLGSLLGGGQTSGQAGQASGQGGGVDLGQLLQLGMGYMQATQNGASPLQALTQVLLSSGSPLSGRGYRAESGALVMQTLMQEMMSGAKPPAR